MNFSTDRCNVRPFEQKDIKMFMEYRNDLEWMQYQSFKGLTYEEYERSLLGNHSVADGVQLAIISKNSDELIGDLYVQQEGMSYWIGYTITPHKARQGYAYEVVSELIKYLLERGASEIKAGALEINKSSISLLEKLNFSYLTMENDEHVYRLEVKPNNCLDETKDSQ